MGEPTVHQSERTETEERPQACADLPPEVSRSGGVALRRLLAVATLTPAQAGLLALDLVEELERLRRDDRRPVRIGDRSATVSDAGLLTLLAEAPGTDHHAEPSPMATAAAAALARRLVANTQRGGSRRRADSALLALHIDVSITDADDLARRIRRAGAEVVGTDDEVIRRTRRELAALVAATKGQPPAPPRDPFAVKPEQPKVPDVPLIVPRTALLAPDSWRPSSRRVWHRRRWIRGRKSVLIALIVVLVAALGWWGVPQAWTQLQHGWDAVFTPKAPSQRLAPVSPPPAPRGSGGKALVREARSSAEHPKRVQLPAPEQAPPVTAVTVERAEGPCTPGSACAVRVDVRLEPAGTAREVSWSLRIIDRCSGKAHSRQGVSMTAQAGWHQVYAISRPGLPNGSALAIVAVTKTPARAASAPLLVPGSGATC